MKKEHIEFLTLQLLKKYKLKGWSVSFFDWKTTAAGLCNENNLTISYSLFFAPKLPKRIMMNIILHEISHAIVGCSEAHNEKWKNKCIELGGTGKIYELSEKSIRKKHAKYISVCKICGEIYFWYRNGKHKCCGENMQIYYN